LLATHLVAVVWWSGVRYVSLVARFDDLPRVGDGLLPAERFRVACELSDAAIRMVRARFRRENPDANEAKIDEMVDEWLATRPGAEHGDGVGHPVNWPRQRS
jgi:hypothetical protein